MNNSDESTVGRRRARRQEASAAATDEVRARFRRARRAGHPEWLWPEIPVAQWRSALGTLETTARSLLTGAPPAPLRATDSAAERALGLASYTSGLGPWLGWHIEQGRLDADDRCVRMLSEHLDHARRRWVRLDRELTRILRALAEAGIEATVIKGAYGARRWFPEPALRPLADVDVLVPPAAMQRSAHVLEAAGYEEKIDFRKVHRPGSVWRRHGVSALPHSLMLVHADDPIDVDLHGSLDIDFYVATVAFGVPDPAFVQEVPMGGTRARVLRQPLLAAHHAVHASLGPGMTLIRLTELSLMLRHDMTTPGDWARLEELLCGLGAERFAWPALALTERLAPGSVAPALLDRCRAAAPPRLRRVVEPLRPATAQHLKAVALQERFMWARGFREHMRRTAAMLVPPDGHRASVRQLGRTYIGRAYQLLRLRVGWSAERD